MFAPANLGILLHKLLLTRSIYWAIISITIHLSVASRIEANSTCTPGSSQSQATNLDPIHVSQDGRQQTAPTVSKHVFVAHNQIPSAQVGQHDSFYTLEGLQAQQPLQLAGPQSRVQMLQGFQNMQGLPQLLSLYPGQQVDQKEPRQYGQEMEQIILHSPDFQIDHSGSLQDEPIREPPDSPNSLTHSKVGNDNFLPSQRLNRSLLLREKQASVIQDEDHGVDLAANQIYQNSDSPGLFTRQLHFSKRRRQRPVSYRVAPDTEWPSNWSGQQDLIGYNPSSVKQTPQLGDTPEGITYAGQQYSAPLDISSGAHGLETEPSRGGPVSVSEIENLLQRLKPLTVIGQEKAETNKNSEEDDTEEEEVDNNGSEVAPKTEGTSAPNSGADKLIEELLGKKTREQTAGKQEVDNTTQQSASDELMFLKSLAQLGHQQQLNPQPNALVLDKFYAPAIANANVNPTMHQSSQSPVPERASEQEAEDRETSSIPIELLVDHLMSGSRKASFGIQHDHIKEPINVLDPSTVEGSDVVGDEAADEMEEDDEEDDEDADNNGTLPLEASESALRFTKMSSPTSNLSFQSVADSSNTWIPVKKLTPSVGEKKTSVGNKSKDGHQKKKNFKKEQTKEKTKKKKRKKKSKATNSDLQGSTAEGSSLSETKGEANGILIGNKLLSRMDLIKLIKVLNKIASKKEASKEREASRKLLKFLIHMAIENFRKAQSRQEKVPVEKRAEKKSHDTIKQSLRSLLEGPLDQPNDDRQHIKNITIIQLRPVDSLILNKTEGQREENNEDGGKNTEPARNHSKSKSLKDISDELEQYFDSDFFEDMADKSKNQSTYKRDSVQTEQDGDESQAQEEDAAKQERDIRSGYRLPVPIYGQQQIDAADEDDVDLDHVRILPKVEVGRAQVATKKLHGGRNQMGFENRKRPRRAKKQPKQASEDVGEDHEDDVDDSDGQTSTKRRRKAAPKTIRDQEAETATKGPIADGQDSEKEEDDSESETKDNHRLAEDVTESEKPEKKSQSPDKRRLQVKKSEVVSGSRNDAKRRKRRRKLSIGKGHGVHSDTRDEIPSPITSSTKAFDLIKNNPGTARTKARTKHISTMDDELSVKGPKRTASKVKIIRKTGGSSTKPAHVRLRSRERKTHKATPRKPSMQNKKVPKKSQLSRKGRDDTTEDNDPADDDNYNEGTSYSNVCDDDGECQVSVKSNNPDIGKAISQNNEPSLVKHLGKWIEDPD